MSTPSSVTTHEPSGCLEGLALEAMGGDSGHYVTTITLPDGSTVQGLGDTPQDSQQVASQKADAAKNGG